MRLSKIVPEGNRTLVIFSKDGEEYYPMDVIREVERCKNSIVRLCGSEPFDQEPLFHVQVICKTLKDSGYTVELQSKYSLKELETKVSDFICHPRSRYLEISNILDTVDVFVQEL